jgi:hypothetical protein
MKMAEVVSTLRQKRWRTTKGAKIAAIFGIVTWPSDLLLHYDRDIGGLVRMCPVGRCGEQISWLIGLAMGWTSAPVFLVAVVCSVRNLLLLRRL